MIIHYTSQNIYKIGIIMNGLRTKSNNRIISAKKKFIYNFLFINVDQH